MFKPDFEFKVPIVFFRDFTVLDLSLFTSYLHVHRYKKGDLEGKNVSVLMPQPFSQRHNTFLKNYIITGGVVLGVAGRCWVLLAT